MDWNHHWTTQGKNPINFREHGEWVLFQVSNVVWQDFLENFKLCLLHSLYNKLLIMAKEEKASTLTRTFTSAENLLSIELWS